MGSSFELNLWRRQKTKEIDLIPSDNHSNKQEEIKKFQ